MFNRLLFVFAVAMISCATLSAQPFTTACNLAGTVAGNDNTSVLNLGAPLAVLQTDMPEFVRPGQFQRFQLYLKFVSPATDIYVSGREVVSDGDQLVTGSSILPPFAANPEGNGHIRTVKVGDVIPLSTDDFRGDDPSGRQYRYDVCLTSATGELYQHLQIRHFIGSAQAKERGTLLVNSAYLFPTNNGPKYLFVMGNFPGKTIICSVGDRLNTSYRVGGPTADMLCPIPENFSGPGTLDVSVTVLETGETRVLPGVIIP